MATRDSGYAPITARTLEDCPEYDPKHPSTTGCKPCRSGASNHCKHPYRRGKTRRENLHVKVKF